MRWLPVLGFEGFYEVSEQGGVRSVARQVVDSRGRLRRLKSRVLSARVHDGYPYVHLSRGAIGVSRAVHVLLAEAFLGPRPVGHEVRHSDGNRSNCTVGNLAWGTPSENQRDRENHGTSNHKFRKCCDFEHVLEAPNLVETEFAKGYSKCKACNRGRASVHNARVRRGVTLDFRTESDRHYTELFS